MKFSVFAIKCYRCGEDGLCINGTEEKLVDCKNGDYEFSSCQISKSLVGDVKVDIKDCFKLDGDAPHLEYAGCLKITSDIPGGVST